MDSLLKIYPQLTDVNYYWELVNKKFLRTDTMQYATTKIAITHKDFLHLVSMINLSGYWAMPHEFDCVPTSMDGYGFHLEANTPKRYNIVGFGSCEMNTPMQKKFVAACQEMMKYAKLDNKIDLASGWKAEFAPVDTIKH